MKSEELFELLRQKNAYYEAVVDARGVLRSPLVAYTATYEEGGKRWHHVGRHYVNFPNIERDAWALRQFVDALINQLNEFFEDGVVLLAAPWGGVAFTVALGQRLLNQGVLVQHLYMEKMEPMTANDKPGVRSKFMLRRHHIPPGSRVILIDDVLNTGSSVEFGTMLVRAARAEVIAVGCAVSRSEMHALSGRGRSVPLRSALQISAPYYRQSDPFVRAAIQADQVELDPRENWPRLLKAQERAQAHLKAQ